MKTPVSLIENIDCMEFMARYPDKHFELAIVDPPYGIGESSKQRAKNAKPCKTWKNAGNTWVDYKKKSWDNYKPDSNYFNELFRVSKNQIIWGGNYFINCLYDTKSIIIWDKLNGDTDFADGEMAWTSFDKALRIYKYLWAGYKKQMPEERFHPTQKPIQLYKWLLTNYAKEGDKILDTHLGSGSSRIAAFNMGFDFYGCELDPDYFAASEKRFKEQTAQIQIF